MVQGASRLGFWDFAHQCPGWTWAWSPGSLPGTDLNPALQWDLSLFYLFLPHLAGQPWTAGVKLIVELNKLLQVEGLEQAHS